MRNGGRAPPFPGSSREALSQGRRDKAGGLPLLATCAGQSRAPGRRNATTRRPGRPEIVAPVETSGPGRRPQPVLDWFDVEPHIIR